MDGTERNRFNIFSVRNDPEHGTEMTEALDALDMFNNATGYK